ncbi:DsbA family protein [Salinisphaera sp. Q1T1-3]|uniref:DsbA family protein n=1 Tax=Salinisphaera sp. Q1T1-3 TaxID=2321229 RepID=UPI000E75AF49|nr:DsbA family protein [Salinisphaera sp. Q1T1-3]RJS91949.1 DsbA family protein [Salinisphaera sp. Q1T1-3]
MSPQQNRGQSKLFGALFIPALLIGAFIVIAILVMSFTGSERATPRPGDGPTTVDAGVMNQLRNQYDKLAEAKGNPNAPVTIREFGDYQCPACGAFEPTAERIRKEYVDTGKVRFLFYDFPLPMHQHAQAAAVAARCAAAQNDFWPFHNRLYQTQGQWSEQNDPTSMFLDLAVETGLDTNKLKACMNKETPLAQINAERDAGQAVSLRATPTVMVGDTLFVGGPSYDKLKTAIDEALAAAGNNGQ